ncbi:hypothetical protein RAM80_26795 [Pseudomonas sp. App30]|uniref:hypothetical protein n=1 Tax=Pseudomonas sp. App30 TaxID=3068990 RepID=UPI003A80CA65
MKHRLANQKRAKRQKNMQSPMICMAFFDGGVVETLQGAVLDGETAWQRARHF